MAYADLLAVRRQHDMTRVVRMVRDHLSGFPHGQLREEFLTIGIEAATRGGDRPARHEFGQRYLDESPRASTARTREERSNSSLDPAGARPMVGGAERVV